MADRDRIGNPPARDSSVARASVVGVLLCLSAASARAQSYTVSVAESGVSYPTSYTKRFNWRYYGDLRHTTRIASSTDPNACEESPCLDDGEAGDQPPDGTRAGIASGSLGGMIPGLYTIEMKCRRSDNRATSVPWSVTTDAASNNQIQGTLDLRNDLAISSDPTGSWFVVGDTDETPISVQGWLTFSFGANSGLDGSLSYGGLRAAWVCPLSAACLPDEVQTQPCGSCGSQSRTCGSGCQWGVWSACTGEGVCAQGDEQPCGACGGSQSCTETCQWGSCEEECLDGGLPDAAEGLDDGSSGGDGDGTELAGRVLQGGCRCGVAGRVARELPVLVLLGLPLVALVRRSRSLSPCRPRRRGRREVAPSRGGWMTRRGPAPATTTPGSRSSGRSPR